MRISAPVFAATIVALLPTLAAADDAPKEEKERPSVKDPATIEAEAKSCFDESDRIFQSTKDGVGAGKKLRACRETVETLIAAWEKEMLSRTTGSRDVSQAAKFDGEAAKAEIKRCEAAVTGQSGLLPSNWRLVCTLLGRARLAVALAIKKASCDAKRDVMERTDCLLEKSRKLSGELARDRAEKSASGKNPRACRFACLTKSRECREAAREKEGSERRVAIRQCRETAKACRYACEESSKEKKDEAR